MNINKALNLLKLEGYKYTDKREEMIRVFAQQKRYMTAREVLDLMKKRFPSLSFDTVYRNLSLFSELKIIEETEIGGERRYRFWCLDAKDHHHHAICLSCGRTNHLGACPLDKMMKDTRGFVITGHKFEIYGYCHECVG